MKLVDFLKTYSKVSNDFIDDFFGLYDDNDKSDFFINLDDIAKWLDAVKGNLKETLINSYVEDIDYTIIKNKNTGKHGFQLVVPNN